MGSFGTSVSLMVYLVVATSMAEGLKSTIIPRRDKSPHPRAKNRASH